MSAISIWNGLTLAEYNIPLWILGVTAGVCTWFLALLVRRTLRGPVSRWAKRLPGRIDDVMIDTLATTPSWFIAAFALYVGLKVAGAFGSAPRLLDRAMLAFAFVQAGLWLQRALRGWVEIWMGTREGSSGNGTLTAAVLLSAQVLIWSVVLLLVLQNWGVEVGGLLAGLGVGGIAAALALQTALSDMFAALSIYIDRPFDIGDFIVSGDFMGTVERVGLRSTRLISLGGEHLVISNSDLTTSRIRNYRRMGERRVLVQLGLIYDSSYDHLVSVPKLLREVVEAAGNTRFDRAHFRSYGASALEIELVYYVLSSDYTEYMDRQQTINLEVFRRFRELGISFAFPTQTVHVQSAATAPTPRS